MIALARRYRSKHFADLLVQDHVTAVLRGAIARNPVGYRYVPRVQVYSSQGQG